MNTTTNPLECFFVFACLVSSHLSHFLKNSFSFLLQVLDTNTNDKATSTMPSFPNPTKNSILVANFQNVVISCVRAKGKQRCYPSYIKFYTALDREGKGQLIARNDMENALFFDTMIPGGVPVEVMRETLMLHIGKIPSLAYLNK